MPCPEGPPWPAWVCGTVLQSAEVGKLPQTPALQSCPPTTPSPQDFLWHRVALGFCGSCLCYPSSTVERISSVGAGVCIPSFLACGLIFYGPLPWLPPPHSSPL